MRRASWGTVGSAGLLALLVLGCGSSGGAPAQAAGEAAPVLRVLDKGQGGAHVLTGAGEYWISSPLPGVVRVRASRDDHVSLLPSFAIEPTVGEVSRPYQVSEEANAITFTAEGVALRVDPTGQLSLTDGSGHELGRGKPLGGESATLDWELGEGVRVFGLGDKTKGQNRRGHSFEFWNTDAYAWEIDTDPLYKSFPFFVLVPPSGPISALFVDSAARAKADVGEADAGRLHYEATGESPGDIDFYLLAAGSPAELSARFADLSGHMPLPPRWALGYHQSRYGYSSEAEIRNVVGRLRKDRVPVDAIWLDIDYQEENAPFTVDEKKFPTFPAMVEDLAREGTRTIVITDPHIAHRSSPASGYAPYDSGVAGDHFILDESHLEPFVAKVWPGPSVFPEFTRRYTRKWWGTLYTEFVSQGVAGFWNDMNEPATFDDKTKTFPPDVLHRLDHGRKEPHVLVHNAYGSLNVRATYEGLLSLRPDARPFVLTRAASAGAQRYAATWTGDNRATWPHLRASIAQIGNLGVSGLGFVGADIGGFVGCPKPDLWARWLEMGAFQPFYRNHSAKDACQREPWVHGPEWEAAARRAIERRYRLLPYLYTVFEESARTGQPIQRPVWYEFPQDASVADEQDSFLLGSSLLIAPRLEAGEGAYSVHLPAGDWYDTTTGERVRGGREVEVKPVAGLGVRVFARAGSVIPEMGVAQSLSGSLAGPLWLHVWPGESLKGSVYWDDGESFGYQKGASRRVTWEGKAASGAGVSLRASSSGEYAPFWTEVRVVVHGGFERPPTAQDKAGAALPVTYDSKLRTAEIVLSGAQTDFELAIAR